MDEKDLDRILGLPTKKDMPGGSLKCEQCGSSNFDTMTNQLLKCKHCGAIFNLNKSIVNNFVTNIQATNTHSTSNYHIVKSNISEEEFLKEAYLAIAMDEQSPIDVLTANFSPVTCSYSQFMVIDAYYVGAYSAIVGVDHKEQYNDLEKVYDGVSKTWKLNKVVKERTVTDWQPFTGNISVNKLSCVKLGEKDDDKACDYFIKDLETLKAKGEIENLDKQQSSLNTQILSFTQNDINLTIKKGEIATNNDVCLPGDKYKDYDIKISHTINSIDYYLVPEYILEYKYREDKCKISSFKYDLRILGTVPDITKNVKKDISRKTKPYAISSLISSIVVLLFSLISLFVIHKTSLIWINIILIIASITFFTVYHIKNKKIEYKIKDDIYHAKLENLKTFLNQKQLPPLTEDELKRAEKMAKGWRY
ncbi:MAG: hypothetical protein IJX00_01940 [Clostridia bacterium]|nr:hypothetical protein [Clostridia bacterium]